MDRRTREARTRAPTPAPNYPTINDPAPEERPLPPLPPPEAPHPLQGAVSEGSLGQGLPFRPSYPENIYLAPTLPTHNRSELHHFKDHCRYLLRHRPDYHIQHPFTDIFTFSPHPNIFAGFVWKYRTSIMHNGILEDYRVITPTQQSTEVVQLLRTYQVYHSWQEDSITISFV